MTAQPSMALGGIVLTHSMYSGGTHPHAHKSKKIKGIKLARKGKMQTASNKDAAGNDVADKASTAKQADKATPDAGILIQPAEAAETK